MALLCGTWQQAGIAALQGQVAANEAHAVADDEAHAGAIAFYPTPTKQRHTPIAASPAESQIHNVNSSMLTDSPATARYCSV
jgi:hypothetical protein